MTQSNDPTPATPVQPVTVADRVHRPAGDAEEVYFEGSPLLRGELGKGFFWLVVGLALLAVPIVLRLFMHQWPNPIVSIVAIALGLIFLFVPWLKAKNYRYRITNYRIDFERGLLSKSIDTLELWHVEDLRFHQSLLDRILGVGTITIISKHPTTPLLIMPSIPNAQPLFKTLEQRVIAVKRQAGVVKMDTGTLTPS